MANRFAPRPKKLPIHRCTCDRGRERHGTVWLCAICDRDEYIAAFGENAHKQATAGATATTRPIIQPPMNATERMVEKIKQQANDAAAEVAVS